jgi:hypothetical protein
MTAPGLVEAPDLVGVGAQSIVNRAQPLGLTWVRQIGTVQDGSDAANCTLFFDGDTTTLVTAASMIGKITSGTRVYIDTVPPAANFIVGIATPGVSFGRGVVGRAESTANSGAVGAEAVVLTITNCQFRAGRAYGISIHSDVTASVANVGTYQVRMPSLVGTVVAIPWQGPVAVGAANNDGVNKTVYVRRPQSYGDFTSDVVLTLSATVGTITATAGATFVRYMQIDDVGDESLFPACFAI